MKLGMIGYGKIVQEFIPGLKTIEDMELTAILGAPGREDRVLQAQTAFAIPWGGTDFGQFLDTGIDTVYIATPNHLHYAYAKQSLLSGRHVIVEKPMTSCLREAEELAALAKERGLFLFEAITTQYLPGFQIIRSLLPEIGEVKGVHCRFSQYSSRYDAFLQGQTPPVFDPAKSGGALMDLNLYNIHLVTGLFGEPVGMEYQAEVQRGIDTAGVLTLHYPEFDAHCQAAKDRAGETSVCIEGTLGSICTDTPAGILGGITHKKADGFVTYHPTPRCGREIPEFTAFRDCIAQNDRPLMERMLEQSLLVSRVMTLARMDAGIMFPADRNV